MNDLRVNGNGNRAEKRSVSASTELFAAADAQAKKRMITNFSEYVRDLIRRDLKGEFKHEPQPVP